MTFDGYCDRIDELAIQAGCARQGASHTNLTGRDAWRDYYDSGLAPEKAWKEELGSGSHDDDGADVGLFN